MFSRGAGSGAVDLVGQDDVGEKGTFAELEFAGFLVIEVNAGQVRGQQVGGELDALELAANRFGKGAQQHGFAGAGHVLQQHMARAEEGGENQIDHLVLANDNLTAIF